MYMCVCACVWACHSEELLACAGAWGQGRRSPGAAALILRVPRTHTARPPAKGYLGGPWQAQAGGGAGGVRGVLVRFPAQSVLEPGAFTSHAHRRLYLSAAF